MENTSWERRANAAEKTVVVLKRKVNDLYDGGPQSQIHRQLEKARLREERNRLRTDQLERYSQELEGEVKQRTRAIRVILDHVGFGFLVIDRDLRIQSGFTRSCEGLFGRAPVAGETLSELLGIVGTPAERQLLLGVDQVFEDILPAHVSSAQLPSRFERERVLKLDASVVRDDADEVEGLLMTVSDITRLEQAERESKSREVLLNILRRRAAFEQFVADTRTGLATASQVDDAVLVRRVVHTIKGNAASWGLDELVERAHAVESSDEIGPDEIAGLGECLSEWLESNHAVLGVDYGDAQPVFEITGQRLGELRAMLQDPERSDEVAGWLRAVVRCPAHHLLGPVNAFVHKLSGRLDKTVQFDLRGADLLVDGELMRPVFAVVPHLIRNAVDHGIEPRAERGEKAPHGQLTITIAQTDERWLVSVADDGRGVPYEQLVAKAVSLGRLTADAAAQLGDDERAALLFADGLSTAATMTDISGRGIGMSAVQAAVTSAGGAVAVTTSVAGTQVEISVPKAL